MKILHDNELWRVVSSTLLDGAPSYELSRSRGPGRPPVVIWARVADCTPVVPKAQIRRLKDDGIVLEFDSRGGVTLRRAGSRKRYDTSLAAIYHGTVKAHVANEKALKRINKRRKS